MKIQLYDKSKIEWDHLTFSNMDLRRLIIPLMIEQFLNSLMGMADTMMVSRAGEAAISAVSLVDAVNILITQVFTALATGGTIICAQYIGRQDKKESIRAARQVVWTVFVISMAISIICVAFRRPLLALIFGKVEKAVMTNSITYMWITACSFPFIALFQAGAAFFQASGDSRFPMTVSVISNIINIVGNAILIFGFHMGVAGAGLATILSQAISALLVLYFLSRSNECYKLTVRKIRFHSDILRHIIKIGLPAGIQSSMFCISNIIIQSTINTFGTDTMAAWTAYGKIDSVFWMLMSAFGISITTFVGQNFGCGKLDRVKKSVRISLVMALGSSMLLSAILLLLGQYIFLLFTDDGNVLELGVHILRTLVPFYATYVLVEVLSVAIRGTGESLRPMLISGFGICVLRIVWITCFLGADSQLNMVLYSYPISWAFTSLLFLIYYLRGNWLKKRIYETSLSL